ncbi:glycosyltransferase family 4 protein [Sporosarcina sp. Sa2YVA2]|uniref:Glycosyltransferase family 4 protein n=1 Tax=Sporosarcina quadrami TaxID=2762234 RepID=A0ABR8U982_9BACL|nr:glycosyltransferase family 4 protein [Sporosarcina quadrami]MBD7984580.1 glycosyltransferase family 4 protein [Sporosarcina quadrami]
MGDKLSVFYLVNIPSPYRVDFFNELGNHCNLTVLFEKSNVTYRKKEWLRQEFVNFDPIFLDDSNHPWEKFKLIKHYLDKDMFDIFVIGGYSTLSGLTAIEILNRKRIPFILNTDGGFIKKDNILKHYIKRRYISSAQNWLSTSSSTTDYLIHYGARKENIHLYPFTSLLKSDIQDAPVSNSKKKERRTKLGIKEEKVIISIGRFISIKGFDTLIRSCESLPQNYGVYIIGGNPTSEYIELKETLNLKNIYFVDFKAKEELNHYYMAADLFVLPTRGDIWGLVINEAMANGLPVITTDKCVAGLELISNEINGYIIPVEDSDDLAIKIKKVLEDENMMNKMSNSNLLKINQYTIENMALQHIRIFKKAILERNTND